MTGRHDRVPITNWVPCPWAPEIAVIGYCYQAPAFELEVAIDRTPCHGHLWIVRTRPDPPRRPYPDIVASGFAKTVAIAQLRASARAQAEAKKSTPGCEEVDPANHLT